jgi:hypothetical protein
MTLSAEHEALDLFGMPQNSVDDQVGSKDEFEIALAEGVEDESLLDDTSAARKFTISTYGADYTVDSLVKRMAGGHFRIPEFQRRFVWSQTHASKFIESLLMGLPVPGIFLYKEAVTNKHLVIDGQQRLKSLQSFYSGLFGEKKFRLTGIRDPWLGKTYSDLDPSDQLKLDDSIVHATIFSQDQPADVLDSIYFVFERINSGGIRLSPQEIRNCISSGPFTDLVKKLNTETAWRVVFGGPENKRAKDEELIIRFFAMLDRHGAYARPMSKFLNDYSASMNSASAEVLAAKAEIFRETIAAVSEALGAKAFRPVRSLNAAVFDAVMVGIASRIANGSKPAASDLLATYEKLLADETFKKGWVRATADEEAVKVRMQTAIDAFAKT